MPRQALPASPSPAISCSPSLACWALGVMAPRSPAQRVHHSPCCSPPGYTLKNVPYQTVPHAQPEKWTVPCWQQTNQLPSPAQLCFCTPITPCQRWPAPNQPASTQKGAQLPERRALARVLTEVADSQPAYPSALPLQASALFPLHRTVGRWRPRPQPRATGNSWAWWLERVPVPEASRTALAPHFLPCPSHAPEWPLWLLQEGWEGL